MYWCYMLQALILQPDDKNCLVARSKCYVKMGDSENALRDAEASLKQDKEFFKVQHFPVLIIQTDGLIKRRDTINHVSVMFSESHDSSCVFRAIAHFCSSIPSLPHTITKGGAILPKIKSTIIIFLTWNMLIEHVGFVLSFQGLYQKAEALYTMGDFEFALVFFHRGHKLRPELQEFRLGIQKAQEAIDNSVGSKL